uniref:Ubiquitin carboxyl-terminal hydrolase n=1 Tax=Paramormyrops kingsleyae TaxID=1676925 RepID=A0A3B3Q289_9TELE
MAEGGGPESGNGAEPDPEPVSAETTVPPPETQKDSIGTLLKTALRKGDEWFLVDNRWFKQWKKYVGFDSWDLYNVGENSLYPGPIDNSGFWCFANPSKCIVDQETQTLKEHLIDELDYVLMPTEAWNKLVGWYGCMEGQNPIVRKVVEHGMFVKHCKVEVYLLELNLCENNNMDNVVTRHFSKADTIDMIEKEMRSLFGITKDQETRLWNKYMSNTYEQLNKPDSTVQDAGLFQGQCVPPKFALRSSTTTSRNFTTSPKLSSNSSATICSTVTNGDSSSSSSSSSSTGFSLGGYNSYSSSYNYREVQSQPGLCGLSNLGNTCFMNSALQCLSNAPPLTEYFLNDLYEAEINRENPLGMRGEIAEAYADLVKQMWQSHSSHVAPRMFKTQVGRFAPQFSGYQQQDSQELLAFLLDGLHEDLNRVKKKPYVALSDADGRPDEVVAKEAWTNHRLRNDSIIVDIFHGLFKSTLVCPECSKISVTFDPFCYLTLPLPMKKDRTMEVFLVRMDPQSRPMQYRVVVAKLGIVGDLCNALSKLSGVPAENMVVADVYNHRFHKIYKWDDALNHIMEKDDIFVYEVEGDLGERVNLAVYFRERYSKLSGGSSSTMLFGQPLLLTVPRQNLPMDMLYEKVLDRISLLWIYFTGEEEAMDHQVSLEQDNSQSDCSVGEEDGADIEDCLTGNLPKKSCSRPKLFSISLVNSYGTTNITPQPCDGNVLKLNSKYQFLLFIVLCSNSTPPQAYEKHESMPQPQRKRTSVALKDCIELFTTNETLGEHDPWYCPTCKKHQQANKKFDLWSLPRVLVVHLKRFSYNRCWRDKLDTVVDFPIRDLNMSEFVCDPKAGPYVYDLIAVSNHYGGMGGGHYTAYAKNKIDGKWYYFDDSSVSSATEDQIVTKAAYVLFYQRRDETPAKPPPSASLGGAPDCGDDHMDTN